MTEGHTGRYSQPKIPMFNLALMWDNSSYKRRHERFCAWLFTMNLNESSMCAPTLMHEVWLQI